MRGKTHETRRACRCACFSASSTLISPPNWWLWLRYCCKVSGDLQLAAQEDRHGRVHYCRAISTVVPHACFTDPLCRCYRCFTDVCCDELVLSLAMARYFVFTTRRKAQHISHTAGAHTHTQAAYAELTHGFYLACSGALHLLLTRSLSSSARALPLFCSHALSSALALSLFSVCSHSPQSSYQTKPPCVRSNQVFSQSPRSSYHTELLCT